MLETIPEPKIIDPIVEAYRQTVENEIRRSIILVFRYQPAWSEGGLELALKERHVSMTDFYRHYNELGIIQKKILDPKLWSWYLWYVPEHWKTEDSK
jgi:hypothetical protein